MKRLTFIVMVFGLMAAGCKKEYVTTYGVNDVNIEQPGANKPNIKSDLEFISIAYTDLFGNTIPPNELEDLALAYQSLGDKNTLIDMIILNFLNEPGLQIPTDAQMRADVESFVATAYRKFFVREPSAFEQWFIANKINADADITPELAWYAFMTSQEYRFY